MGPRPVLCSAETCLGPPSTTAPREGGAAGVRVLPPALLSLSGQALLPLGPVAGALTGIGPLDVTLVSPPPEAWADPASGVPGSGLRAAGPLRGLAPGLCSEKTFQGPDVVLHRSTQEISCKSNMFGIQLPVASGS